MSNLGGVEESGAIRAAHCANEHTVSDAGDEIADVLIATERRKGFAEGFYRIQGNKDIAFSLVFGRLLGRGIGGAATRDGEVFNGWVEGVGFGRRGLRWGGFGHVVFSLFSLNATIFFIMRKEGEIICKGSEGKKTLLGKMRGFLSGVRDQ
jgi:hypothetical protein